jgi:hypothetical protein
MTPLTIGLRIAFDQVNQISLIRVAGRLADESLVGLYHACHKYSDDVHASVSIVDLSSVSEFALSSESIRNLAGRKPATADSARLCFIVAPDTYAFGLCRMFQLVGQFARPLLQVVHTMEEAFAAIGIPCPHDASSVVSVPGGALPSASMSFSA